jgi:hypothetical protein
MSDALKSRSNGTLDSLSNLESHHQLIAKESSGNDAVDGESWSSQESENGSKFLRKTVNQTDDFTLLSSILSRHEPDGTVVEESIGRKQYECRKCGQPLKGHVCSLRAAVRSSGGLKPPLLQRRYRWRSRVTLSDDEPQSLVTKMNSGGDEMWNPDDESSWDEDKDEREIWSKKANKSKAPSVGRRLGSDSERAMAVEHRRQSFLSDNDADRVGTTNLPFESKNHTKSSTSVTRAYQCRKCGVPRKGHICTHDSLQSRMGSSTESLIPAQILMEEIRLFLQDSRSAYRRNFDLDAELLQLWAADVYNKFSQVIDGSGKKVLLIDKRKSFKKGINKERDTLIAVRSKIRQIQNDCQILEDRIADFRQKNAALIGATNFLKAIDTLR